MGHANTSPAEARDFVCAWAHAVRNPAAIATPSDVLELLDTRPTELGQRELVVLGVLSEVGVEPNVQALGQLGGSHHQLWGHRERRARRQASAGHRAMGAIVVSANKALALGEDLVLVHHDVVRRQTAVFDRQAHRAVRRMKTQAEVERCLDLGA